MVSSCLITNEAVHLYTEFGFHTLFTMELIMFLPFKLGSILKLKVTIDFY